MGFWGFGVTLVGIRKEDKPIEEDARPIVVGEFWRRVACKLALAADKSVCLGQGGGGGYSTLLTAVVGAQQG